VTDTYRRQVDAPGCEDVCPVDPLGGWKCGATYLRAPVTVEVSTEDGRLAAGTTASGILDFSGTGSTSWRVQADFFVDVQFNEMLDRVDINPAGCSGDDLRVQWEGVDSEISSVEVLAWSSDEQGDRCIVSLGAGQ